MNVPTYPAYPTAADVEAHARSTGIWPADDNSGSPTYEQLRAQGQAEVAIKWIIGEWERRVNWYPFLASGDATEERTFDEISRDGYIDLQGGLVSITSLSIAGEVMSAGEYRLEPLNSDKKGKPFEDIRLLRRRRWYFRDLGQIVVSGRWGYCAEVPADVWGAMVETAALGVMKATRNEQNVSSISMDSFEKDLDVVGTLQQKDLANLWATSFSSILELYRRKVLTV